MDKILEALSNFRFPLVALLAGVLFILLSFYSVSGPLNSPSIAPAAVPNVVLTGLGIVVIASGVLLFALQEDLLLLPSRRVRTAKDGLETRFRLSNVHIKFGVIQSFFGPPDSRRCAILPINDLFELTCFQDKQIALGSFLATFCTDPADMRKLMADVESRLATLPSVQVPNVTDGDGRSFGIGTTLVVRPAGHSVVVVSVSTKRPHEGVLSEVSFVAEAVKRAMIVAAENELTNIYLPLIGSGKGGLVPSVALMVVLNAIFEVASRPSGHHAANVTIVVYQATAASPPTLARSRCRSVLRGVQAAWIGANR